jgi:hypothetical protein
MRPSRSILAKALTLAVLAGVLVPGSAFAQFQDPTLKSLGLTTEVQRSPRLLGMGGLSLVVPDHYQRLTLWDFARNPVGIEAADTASTLILRPGTASMVNAYDMQPGLVHLNGGLREDLAGRSAVMPYEMVRRDGEGNAYGAVGSLGGVHSDRPYDDVTETRFGVSHPEIMPFLTGPLPWFGSGKLHYALTLLAAKEQVHVQYRQIVKNAGGDFITLDGQTVSAPDFFQPVDYDVRTLGFGVAASYPLGSSHLFALNAGQRGDRIHGSDQGDRASSQVTESRPTNSGQATLVGHVGKSLEYGIDGHAWSATSQQDWVFTISSGSGIAPLAGRGKLLEREARGTSLDSHARWTAGRFGLDGQVWTNWSRVKIIPPADGDLSSFNRFLGTVYYRVGADTLALPDSVVANRQESHATGYGVGASWKLRKGIAGVEYHWARDAFAQTYAGAGPRQVGWDVRGGLEWTCSEVITGRLGAGFGAWDADEYTLGNEWTSRSGSIGLGVHPRGTSWSVEAGYSLAWIQSDFGDPLNHRGSRQHLESLVHWNF